MGFWPASEVRSETASVHNFLIRDRLTHTHIERDFDDSRNLHDAFIAKSLHELADDLILVFALQSGMGYLLKRQRLRQWI
jgi:hypothetical protein